MPRMDGYQTTQAIRAIKNQQLARMPIHRDDGQCDEGRPGKCPKAGMDDYLSKPVTKARLLWLLDL